MVTRRAAALVAPVVVPGSMAAVFGLLARWLPPRRTYNVGFGLYRVGWCLAFPRWVLGPRRAERVLWSGWRPTAGEAVVLAVPVLGAVVAELLPQRQDLDPGVVAVLVGSAAVNAVGEELLWRGVFLEEFPGDLVRSCLWPLGGFALWHLAPQIVLPSRLGRVRFALGAAVVGSASGVVAWRGGELRATLLPHGATDACGVTAARFRLER